MEANEIKRLISTRMQSALAVASMIVTVLGAPLSALSDQVTIEGVAATCEVKQGERVCSFSVTVRHNDEGWDHYANQWQVISEERVLGTRVLNHPHVDEQPFTRSLKGVRIPVEVSEVRIRAWDSKNGKSPDEYLYKLP